jgi:polysaccharide deacetylase 2 family uncharacterized protein YibQ
VDKSPKKPTGKKHTTQAKRKKSRSSQGNIKGRSSKQFSPKTGVRAALVASTLICIAGLVFIVLLIIDTPFPALPSSEPLLPVELSPPSEPPVSSVPNPVPMPVDPVVAPAAPLTPTEPAAPIRPIPRQRGSLAFVIDDAGNNLADLEPFLHFPGPLTIAVLPGLAYSAETARRIRAAGKEVFLHQPMEALGGQDPGPGAVYAGMGAAEIRTIVERNIAEIGPIAGMNNHQGSKVTMDGKAMETILAICRDYGIYFLDSRTTADTAAPELAKRMGMKIGERDVFIDNMQEKSAMIRAVQEGLQKTEKKGAVIMIGHTWSSELAATLGELYPELIERGFSLSTISQLIMGGSPEGSWD